MKMDVVDISGLYSTEHVSEHTLMSSEIERVVLWKKTKYQEVAIVVFKDFGLSLILDGYTQSSVYDEYIYHESLVHPVMVGVENPKRVLIIGGGEGATLREALKYSTVQEAVMVDIDGELVEIAKKYLVEMHQGAFEDPRAKVVIADGAEYIRKAPDKSFDVVILDLTDPYSSEIARNLYSEQFYKEVYRVLSEKGAMVTQAGSSFFFEKDYNWVLENVRKVFPKIMEYNVWIPTFGYACNFIIGAKNSFKADLDAKKVDEILKARKLKDKLKFYSGKTHIAILNMPIYRVKK